jgi:hypothetical protein
MMTTPLPVTLEILDQEVMVMITTRTTTKIQLLVTIVRSFFRLGFSRAVVLGLRRLSVIIDTQFKMLRFSNIHSSCFIAVTTSNALPVQSGEGRVIGVQKRKRKIHCS